MAPLFVASLFVKMGQNTELTLQMDGTASQTSRQRGKSGDFSFCIQVGKSSALGEELRPAGGPPSVMFLNHKLLLAKVPPMRESSAAGTRQ